MARGEFAQCRAAHEFVREGGAGCEYCYAGGVEGGQVEGVDGLVVGEAVGVHGCEVGLEKGGDILAGEGVLGADYWGLGVGSGRLRRCFFHFWGIDV